MGKYINSTFHDFLRENNNEQNTIHEWINAIDKISNIDFKECIKNYGNFYNEIKKYDLETKEKIVEKESSNNHYFLSIIDFENVIETAKKYDIPYDLDNIFGYYINDVDNFISKKVDEHKNYVIDRSKDFVSFFNNNADLFKKFYETINNPNVHNYLVTGGLDYSSPANMEFLMNLMKNEEK